MTTNRPTSLLALWTMFVTLLSVPLTAQISVHPVILDMPATELQRAEFEVANSSSERVYVSIEPVRIDSAGTPVETRIAPSDPEELGLLASPPRLIVEPGERRFVRVAALLAPGLQDRIFRVAVKPVVGDLTGEKSGLKVLVGYDLLAIQRPEAPSFTLDWQNRPEEVTIRNTGNSNGQLFNGRACQPDEAEELCTELPSGRLYAGSEMTVAKPEGTTASYDVLFMGKSTRVILE
jgi:P pilus assembly chaperone PapD